MRYYLLSFVLILILPIFGQLSNADRYYQSGYFKEASVEYKDVLEKEKLSETTNLQVRKKLADSYFCLRDMKNSIKQYDALIKLEQYDSITLIRYIELKRNLGEYDAAKGYVDLFSQKYLTCEDCDFFEDYLRITKVYWPQKNQEVDNSLEMKPLLKFPNGKIGMGYDFIDDSTLVAGINIDSSDKATTFYDLGNISVSTGFSEFQRQDIPGYNSFYRAYPSYSESTKTLFYNSNGSAKKKFSKKKSEKFGYSNDGRNTLQIYQTKINVGVYEEANKLDFCDPLYNYAHPSINETGDVIFFVSDMTGGEGGYDVYYAIKRDNVWGTAINCGPNVNTPFDELTPFISGDSLFFSSYGSNGYGGSDVFMSQVKADTVFEKGTNLGMPINSTKDDFSFLIDRTNSYALLTSNRDLNSEANDVVYQVFFPKDEFTVVNAENGEVIPEVKIMIDNNGSRTFTTDEEGKWVDRITDNQNMSAIFDNPWYETKVVAQSEDTLNSDKLKTVSLDPITINGTVIDAITGKPLEDVKVSLFKKDDAGDWQLVDTKQTNDKGDWDFYIRKDKEYKVEFDKERYVDEVVIIPRKDENKQFFIEAMDDLNPFELSLEPIANNKLQIDNIYFEFNKSGVKDESLPILDNIVNYLNKNPSVRIELSAHTDCVGSDAYNKNLSQKRAKSCFDYLVAKGIDKNRVVPVGYGESEMINKDCDKQRTDKEYAQKNRRVEVKIL